MRGIEPFFIAYVAAWGAACLAAALLVVLRPADFSIAGGAYRRYLLQPWKIATFAVAATGITVIAPYTGDPTWDYFDAALMAALTFATAPWAVGTLHAALRRRAPAKHAFVALCLWLFSASWCYDLYLVLRDGRYPDTWLANMAASSILYLLAGMLWNLEWRPGRGATFGFLEPGWPDPAHAGGFARLVWFALPIMLMAGGLIVPFLWGGWG